MPRSKFAILIILFIVKDVHAIGGAGDVVWDPKLEAQVIAVYNQTVELYNNAKDQLKTAAEMNRTIYEAEQAYDAIVNFDLKVTANQMFGFDSAQGAEGRWKIQGLLTDLNKMESAGRNTGRFYDYQLGRLANMQAMFDFQESAAENITAATEDIPVRQSGQITAQSTASMSALMAAEDLRQQQAQVEKAQAAQYDRQRFYDSKHIYRALAGSEER